ncbi:MAG: hypothetical protein AAF447_11825 [Myxococcota bacterium]
MRSRRVVLVVLVVLGSLAKAGLAAAQPSAAAALERTLAGKHSHWVHQLYEPDQTPAQRACWDRIANRAGALTTILEERRALGPVKPGLLADVRRQLAALEHLAGGGCREERTTLGEVDVEFRGHPFRPRLRRTGLSLRAGYRYERVPRAQTLYARTASHTLDLALGGFVLPWLRLEGTLRLGTAPEGGAHGAFGGRALLVAPWGLLRLSGGVGVALAMARDRQGNTAFGWVGPQLELPAEVGFELSERWGLSLTGGLLWTHPGQAPRSAAKLGGFGGFLLEAAL